MGRPLGVEGLPEAAKTPAFATAAGLMVFPQVVAQEHAGGAVGGAGDETDDDSYVARVRRWLQQSF
jgi:cell division protein FtsA